MPIAPSPIPTVNSAQLIATLKAAIPRRHAVLIVGDPGIGKTAIVQQVAKDLGMNLITSVPSIADPTDFKGMPPLGGGKFLPIGEAAEVLAATEPTIWFLDDLAQGNEDVQKALMPALHGRMLGGHKIPDCVSIVAATNDRTNGAGVRGVLTPVKGRFHVIIKLAPDLDYWLDWALGAGISPMSIAFLKRNPDDFHRFEQSVADMTMQPNARTWEHLSDIEQHWGLDDATERINMEGAVGAATAGRYRQFKLAHRSLVDVADILANPRTAALPKSPGEMYAVAVTLGRCAKRSNFPAVATYCERLFDAGHGEVSTLIMRTAEKIHPDVVMTSTYIAMQTHGKYGVILSGR